MKPALLLLILLCASQLQAVEPKAVISPSGPINVPSGMGFVLSADGSVDDTDAPTWHVSSIVGAVKGNQIIFVAPAAGVYSVELTVGGIVDGKVKLANASTTVTVGGNPLPPPGPLPPVPPVPVDKYHLAKVAYDSAMQVPAGPRAKASLLAASYDQLIAQINSGELSTVQQIFDATRQKNAAIVGTDATAWEPARAALAAAVTQLYSSGQMVSKPDFATAWGEISTGLKGVK